MSFPRFCIDDSSDRQSYRTRNSLMANPCGTRKILWLRMRDGFGKTLLSEPLASVN